MEIPLLIWNQLLIPLLPPSLHSRVVISFLKNRGLINILIFVNKIRELMMPIVDLEKDILLLEAILNSEPLSPLPNHANYFPGERKELKICEAKTNETSIDKPSEVELKDLPPHLEYAFLEGDNKLPVIIAKDLSVGEKAALIKVFFPCPQGAIAWKLSISRKDSKARLSDGFCSFRVDFDVVDTKGAENLAADHLSRLESPHENKLDPKEINEKFPLETLSSIAFSDACTPMVSDIATITMREISVFKGMSTS
ncbi:hypothetical protein Tco_0791639 [Tanacetum coccineum]